MDKEEESGSSQDNHQAEDLSAKMARKSKPIPPPLNLTPMGETETSTSPLKDFAMLATSPRSPLVQKNLPFRKRAHSYSSTQTSSECDSPESPRVPASPVAREPAPAAPPSPCYQIKSPLSSPTSHFFNKRFLQEPIKSLLPSPNTSASFFNNECDPIKSPMASLSFFRPTADLLALPMMEKNSIKSPLQTPTRSVFLQNHVDTALFDMDKFPLKSPLNTPTRPGFLTQNPHDLFVMPEPISVKLEPADHMDQDRDPRPADLIKMQKDLTTKFRNEKENIADMQFQSEAIKQEPVDPMDASFKPEIYDLRSPMTLPDLSATVKVEEVDSRGQLDGLLPLDCHKPPPPDYQVKKEPPKGDDRSHATQHGSTELIMNHFIENKLLENYKLTNKNFLLGQNFGYYCSELTDSYLNSGSAESFGGQGVAAHGTHPSHEYHEATAAVNHRLGLLKTAASYAKPQTYKSKGGGGGGAKRGGGGDKLDEEGGKKSKKELDEERPRRPMNAFMLFAKHQRPLLIQQHPGKDNRAISVVLGNAWRELEANERADYVRRAAAMATEHKRRHPDCWKRRRVRVNATAAVQSGPTSSNPGTDVVAPS